MLERVDFVLVRPSHPGNVGAAARAIRVMGFGRLVLVDPRMPHMNLHPDAVALASGADDVLASVRTVTELDAALAGHALVIGLSASEREFVDSVASPEAAAIAVRDVLDAYRGASAALVFGTERTGLTIAEAQRCGLLCRIPGADDYRSLNLAQAVQVMAYVLRGVLVGALGHEHPARSPHADDMPATHDQTEGMLAHLERALITIGFLDPGQPKRLMPRLRRLFFRARPRREDIDILRGICTRIERLATDRRDESRAVAATFSRDPK
ncbi:MAG: RNA methyltransferase [Burkholderiaceae bacterium]|nr:RNA methyltransferase [Burkholderiaceae bacterium]